MRHAPERTYTEAKAHWRDLVAACGGPSRAARITRGCQSRLSESMSPACLDRFPALDQIVDLELECGEPLVTRWLADISGCDVVPRPMPRDAAPRTILDRVSRVIAECGDAAASAVAALADGVLSETERAAVARDIDAAVAQLHALKAAVRPRPAPVPRQDAPA